MPKPLIRSLRAGALILSVTAWSCARQETTQQTDTTTTAMPADTLSGGAYSDTVDLATTGGSVSASDTSSPVSGTLAELRGRLRAEADRLDRDVAAGALRDAGSRALKVRDLVVALAGKTSTLPAAKVQEIEASVSTASEATEKLRAQAATGNHDGVKAHNAEVQGIVTRILALTAPA